MKTENVQQHVSEMYIAILFTANADCGNLLPHTGFAGEVLTAQTENNDTLVEAVRRASRLFLYFDATGTGKEAGQEMINQFLHLWNNGLKEKRNDTFVALRTDGSTDITQKLLGFTAGTGLYFFTLKPNSNVWIDDADTPLASVPLRSVGDTLQAPAVASTELPEECKKQIIRNLRFYYEREKDFNWTKEGTLHTGETPPSSEVEERSIVVDVSILYSIYSAVGSKDRYISAEIKGAGYKTNIRTRDHGDDFVYPYWVHTGDAYTGNLLRKYTVQCELLTPSGSGQILERLPENIIKSTEITASKTHNISITGEGGGGKDGGEGSGAFSYSYQWSSSISYVQSDFEMNNSFTNVGNSRKVIWKTIPCLWFHKDAYRDNDTRNELNVEHITKSWVGAGDGTVYYDLHSSDFPMGFHNMAPQASVLFYTQDDSVKVETTCQIEIQDSKQYWCAGTRHDGQHEWKKRGEDGSISHKDNLEITFNDGELII